jgi:signal transduction histidine kinase
MLREMSKELRTISHLLHPPLLDESGLGSALRWYVEGYSERSHIPVELEISAELGRLSSELETAIFRVVQECLTNIHRHSGSETAEIRLMKDANRVTLEVRDFGKGMKAESGANGNGAKTGVGLRGMRERIHRLQGRLDIRSNENKGTTVTAVFPLSSSTSPEAQPVKTSK